MRIGVVTEAFGDAPLEGVLAALAARAPSVSAVELASGGYPATPHCERALLLRDDAARERWRDAIESRGFRVAALNAWGNPLHPDAAIAQAHDRDLRESIRLAAALGVERVLALAGCPGEGRPRFAAGGWLPYLEGEHERQWREVGEPYWRGISEYARREHPSVAICVELHPGTLVYNTATFEELAACGDNLAANVDPSHFFWTGIDPLAVAARLSRVAYAHLKDVAFDEDALALNGVLDHRWPSEAASWRFATVGRGRDASWWRSFLDVLSARGVTDVAIEHEDALVPAIEGIAEAATVLAAAEVSA
jgi:sugar phosphate isomerase/epimerase